MIILPAIDLLSNQAVRLYKGDYSQKTVYSDEPWTLASQFFEAGAKLIHLVDLDAAREGQPTNQASIQKIRNTVPCVLEVGGGLRDMDKLKFYDDLGIQRLILGTAAVTNPSFVDKALETYGNERIVIGVDAKDGDVKVAGWEKGTSIEVFPFLQRLESQGVKHIIYTDISKDGTLAGPNTTSYKAIKNKFHFSLIASGGIGGIEDLEELFPLDLFGAITGKAIYEEKLDLKIAIQKYQFETDIPLS